MSDHQRLAGIENATFDAIIIGAGINGAGIARDAALRGLRVLLLDKEDIGAGTTATASRLIHGGLRYLEHAEVGLVRESLHERERLLAIAPHLVKPLAMVIPIYEGQKRGPLLIRAGMIAYDTLSLHKSVDHHHMLSRREALERVPGLNPVALKAAAVYFDAQVEFAERLAVENVLDARAHGAAILTHARVDRLIVEQGQVRGVEVTDELGGRSAAARAAVTINVAGPWVDQVLAELERPEPRLMGGTKGSHLIVPPFKGAPHDALYVEARADGRPYFIIPWNHKYLIGTTDIRYTGDLNNVVPDVDEIDYLLRETNQVIPNAQLSRNSVISAYAGIRPLPYQPEGKEGAITRRHIVHDHAPALNGLISIVGGKLTTYRQLAQETVDLVAKKVDRRVRRSETATTPLPGAEGDLSEVRRELQTSADLYARSANHLLRVYGTRAPHVLALAASAPDLAEPFDHASGALGAEVVFAFRHELAETLTDVLLRRTMVGLGAPADSPAPEAAAAIAGRHLGWSPERQAQELAAYHDFIRRYHPLQQLEPAAAAAPATNS